MSGTDNREIRSSVFADLFGDDEVDGKRNFLSLYNAIHGTSLVYEETRIERKTIPQSVYKTFRNDVSMLIDGRLIVFVEHQSTLNENMPLRFLEYFVHILYGMVPARARYRRSLVKIPSPEFYVFYNGSETSPSEDELRLSDAFLVPQEEPFCELRVRFENISGKEGGSVKGKLPIRENCGILREYCQFMELVFRKKAEMRDGDGRDCYEAAIREAVSRGILTDYLSRRGTEVMNMFIDEYDYATDIAVQREEAFEDGMEQGMETGLKQGISQATRDLALNMLRMNLCSAEKIAQATGLPLEDIEALAKGVYAGNCSDCNPAG